MSGPSLGDAALKSLVEATSPQLYLPAHCLTAGSVYVLAVTLQDITDSSKTSQSTVQVSVGFLPIVARVRGGSSFVRSIADDVTLDASQSLDLDRANLPASEQVVS